MKTAVLVVLTVPVQVVVLIIPLILILALTSVGQTNIPTHQLIYASAMSFILDQTAQVRERERENSYKLCIFSC